MDEINIEKLLTCLFNEDYINNGEHNYISQLAVIIIKSLMPMTDEEAVRIDYTRFIEELRLWVYYRNKENPSLLNIQGRMDSKIYWDEKDNSIISRVIPLVLANNKYEIIEEEVIKNVLFTTGNLEALLEWISIVYLLYLVIQKEDNIIDKLKENIIGFSQIEFLNKYEKYYKLGIKEYPGNFKVEFEREKIHLLNTLNGIYNNRYNDLLDCLDVMDSREPKYLMGNILYKSLLKEDIEYNLPKFYLELAEYIIRLRKSRIDPAYLRIKEYILPDIFSFNEGEVFFHSLLKESKVIKKEVRDNAFTSLVQTRTGMYLFKK